MPDLPEMLPVTSSHIAAIGYDQLNRYLVIEFNSGHTYGYSGVDPDVWDGLRSAQSVGSYFHQNIRGRYEAAQL